MYSPLSCPAHNFSQLLSFIHFLPLQTYFFITAFFLTGSFLLICGYVGTTTSTAVIFLTIAVGSHGLALSGFGCNHLDIAPRYGGVLMGLTNTIATITGIIGPYIAKAIAHEVNDIYP